MIFSLFFPLKILLDSQRRLQFGWNILFELGSSIIIIYQYNYYGIIMVYRTKAGFLGYKDTLIEQVSFWQEEIKRKKIGNCHNIMSLIASSSQFKYNARYKS